MPYKVQVFFNGGKRVGKGWRTHSRFCDEDSAVMYARKLAEPPQESTVLVWSSDSASKDNT
jgi:hypothetical protein